MHTPTTGELSIDLGKTSCRVRLVCADGVLEEHGPGAPGFAAGAEGVTRALASIDTALARLPGTAVADVRRIGIGAAGVDANPAAATRFATAVATRLTAPVALVSDALAAHAGALGGQAGTVLIAGTGAVAFHLDRDGVLRRADGWGIWLGDLGSGRWIGQEGLRRSLQARDLVGPPTALTEAAARLGSSLEDLPRYISDSAHPERLLAAFAPTVLDRAEAGDAVAATILDEAVGHLASTAAACTAPGDRLAAVGGLTSSPFFLDRLRTALDAAGLSLTPALADALSGAQLIQTTPSLPHERQAIRVQV